MTIDLDQMDKTLAEAYRPGTLPFCHDPKYKLRFGDRVYCSLSEQELQRCPALKQQCSKPASPEELRRSETKQSQNDSQFSIGPLLAGVAEVVFWLLLAALVAGLLVAIARSWKRRDAEPDDDEAKPGRDQPFDDQAPAAPQVSGDTDVQRLLDKARRAAEQGQLGPAIDAAHAAAVQGLSASGHIAVEPDRTNGDYLRDLRKTPPLHQDFRAIVGQVEAAQFGGAVPSRSTFDQVFDRVTSMLRRLAVLSLFVLLGCGASGDKGQTETRETAPSGLYTFKRLLSDQGVDLHTRIAPLGKLEDIAEIIDFGADLEDEERGQLLRWVKGGGRLVVIGTADFMDEGDVEHRFGTCGTHAERAPGDEEKPLKLVVVGRHWLKLDTVPSVEVSRQVHAVCGDQPYAVTSYLGDGSIVFIPEDDFFTNASLSVADNARLALELTHIEEGNVELIGPWTGVGSQSPIQSLQSAGMLPFMLQLLGLALLVALRRGTSFGARRDDTRRERRAFADHVRAVASTYARAEAGRMVSGHYGLLLIELLRERVCPGQSPSLLELAAAVARRTGRGEPQVVQLLVDAKATFDEGVEGRTVEHHIIRELEQLSLQVGGAS